MFNTGTVIGVMAVVYGDDFQPTDIPSFCWGGATGFVEHDLKKAVATARTVMRRRGQEPSGAEIAMIEHIFTLTADRRKSQCRQKSAL
jgi:hypothetical protein